MHCRWVWAPTYGALTENVVPLGWHVLQIGEVASVTLCVMKRYGVLHPYPLPSLWRSLPGQIRNFPVDATAS